MRVSERSISCLALSFLLLGGKHPAGQELIDRVVARVEGQAITLADARAMLGLGLVDVNHDDDPIASAIRQLIDRNLLLAEVGRVSPGEPDPASVEKEVVTLRSRAGAQLQALSQSTGLDDQRIEEIARDNLRIQAYLNQRFGASIQASEDEVAQYYRAHLDEFQRNGQPMPFENAETAARQKASAERRKAVIAQWLGDLRRRADVVELYKKP
jgi:hypothetical protein